MKGESNSVYSSYYSTEAMTNQEKKRQPGDRLRLRKSRMGDIAAASDGQLTLRSFWSCGVNGDWPVRWRAVSGGRIVLHGIGFPAILPGSLAGDTGDNQRTVIEDVERDRHAELTRTWIEGSESLYSDIREGIYQKYGDYAS